MVGSISPEQLAANLREGSDPPLLLDVREPDERAAACIEPSVHIPMNEIPLRLAELPRDRLLVVYCHHGQRSAMVAGYLERAGFARVSNLTGGIDAWSLRVDRTVRRYE